MALRAERTIGSRLLKEVILKVALWATLLPVRFLRFQVRGKAAFCSRRLCSNLTGAAFPLATVVGCTSTTEIKSMGDFMKDHVFEHFVLHVFAVLDEPQL